MFKKSLAFALALISLCSALAACGGEGKPSEQTTASTTAADTLSETTAEQGPDLPDKDFGGKTVMFLTEKHNGYEWYTSREIYAAEQTGELFNDTVYNRNMAIEEKYNLKIEQANIENASNAAKKSLTAGDTEYDVVMSYINSTLTLAQQGLLMDLNSVPYLELERSWWDQRANENLTINGKLFITTGDISILDNECTMVMFFNKDIIKNYSLDNPYELVNSGKWTLDTLSELSLGVTSDLNGDGKLTNDDMWGLSCAGNAPISFYFSAGNRIAQNNADGELELCMNNERTSAAVEKIMTLCLDPNVLSNHTGHSDFDYACEAFNAGRILFTTFALVDINGLRDAQFEFGILPYPKYDENQESYNNLISSGLVSSTSVPYNCKDTEIVGLLLEALAYSSVDTLTVAYYDNALKTRYIRDDESADMLDIIFATRVYDLGFIFDWGGAGSLITNMFSQKKNEFASSYAKIADKAAAKMQETIDAFDAIQ
ncbi:MAG: ABC transporter substrate-binding protein [Eubacteriales bacterium]